MKISKQLLAFEKGNFKQSFDITVEFDGNEVTEVVCVDAMSENKNTNELDYVDIKQFLESQHLLDTLVNSIDWKEIYMDNLKDAA